MNNILLILKKEIKEVFRDKKSLSMMLIIPMLIPAVVIGFSALFDSEQNIEISEYNKIGFNYELNDTEKQIAENMNIRVTTKNIDELKTEYNNGNINLYIVKENNNYTITGNNSMSNISYSLAENYLNSYKQYLQNEYLNNKQINSDEVMNIITINENIEEIENFSANYIVVYTFLFILMAITVSATYPATDTTAGEKERGTLETLLTFPIKAKDIIIGKFLCVSITSIITGVLSLLLALISLLIANDMFIIYEGTNIMLSPIQIIFAITVIITYSFMISGLCISIASKSKTFKEAQSSLTPLTFISLFPGMIAFMIDVKSNFLLSLIPFLNSSIIFTDITNGNINILNIIAMIISTIITIATVLYIIIKQYNKEKVLFSN